VDETHPQVFDVLTGTWSSWPSPPNYIGDGSCLAPKENLLLLFGGFSNTQGLQIYNISASTWTVQNTTSPFPMYFCGKLMRLLD
jgi:hypothetical protein